MATPRKPLNDGIMSGKIWYRMDYCDQCGERAVGLTIETISLPEPMKPSSKLIGFRDGPTDVEPITQLGITCGCYGRFHRQIAHIQEGKK